MLSLGIRIREKDAAYETPGRNTPNGRD